MIKINNKIYETNAQKAKRIGAIVGRTLTESGMSLRQMSQMYDKYGSVSANTIKNWQNGTSFQSIDQTFQWFEIIGKSPIRYFREYAFPEEFININPKDPDERIKRALLRTASELTNFETKEQLFILSGNHGSNHHFLIDLFCAYCHLTILSRVRISKDIIRTFDFEYKLDEIVCKDDVIPNTEEVMDGIIAGKQAAFDGKNGYTIVKSEENDKRLGNILYETRIYKKFSQEEMGAVYGKRTNTIHNWEIGKTQPNIKEIFEWFYELELNPVRFLRLYAYPKELKIENLVNGSILEDRLFDIYNNMSSDEQRKKLFVSSEFHNSSYRLLLHLFCAYCHLSMRSKSRIAEDILDTFLTEKIQDTLVCKENIMPDTEGLKIAINASRRAALNRENSYTLDI